MLTLEVTHSQADPNVYLLSDGNQILLDVNDMTMLYPKDSTKAAIEVKARL